MSSPTVSIIVPNYNHSKYLNQRLDSILNQTYQDFEVILLDDVSSDNSVEILQTYSKHPKVSHLIVNKQNSGNTFKQWQKGIALAKGTFVWIAESDDFCEPHFLETVINPLNSDETIALAYSQSHRVNNNGEVTGSWITQTHRFNDNQFEADFILDGNTFIEKYLIAKNVIPNASAMVFRKDKIVNDSFLNIEHNLRYCGDWLIYFKLLVNNKVAFVSEALNSFRYHEKSVIAKANKQEDRLAIIDIDFKMRAEMMAFLNQQKPQNHQAIKNANKQIVRKLKYEKALFLINDKAYAQGIGLLLTVFDVFLKHYNFKKKLTAIFK